MKEPGVHSGHVEHPKPEPVNLTEAPVITIADCVKTINEESRLRDLRLFNMGESLRSNSGLDPFSNWQGEMNYATITL